MPAVAATTAVESAVMPVMMTAARIIARSGIGWIAATAHPPVTIFCGRVLSAFPLHGKNEHNRYPDADSNDHGQIVRVHVLLFMPVAGRWQAFFQFHGISGSGGLGPSMQAAQSLSTAGTFFQSAA